MASRFDEVNEEGKPKQKIKLYEQLFLHFSNVFMASIFTDQSNAKTMGGGGIVRMNCKTQQLNHPPPTVLSFYQVSCHQSHDKSHWNMSKQYDI